MKVTLEDNAMDVATALKAAGADYIVQLAPVHGKLPVGDVDIPESRLSYRLDEKGDVYRFGIVGCNYTPVNNQACIEAFDALRVEFGYGLRSIMHTKRGIAAILRQGEVEVVAGDPIGQDIIITTDHGGKGCVRAQVSSIRKVSNAILYGIASEGVVELRARHTKGVNGKLVASASQISALASGHADMLRFFKGMAAKPFLREALESYMDALLGPLSSASPSGLTRQKAKREEAMALINAQQFGSGSWWAAYNGIIGWIEANFTQESSLVGAGADKKRKALEMAVVLSKI